MEPLPQDANPVPDTPTSSVVDFTNGAFSLADLFLAACQVFVVVSARFLCVPTIIELHVVVVTRVVDRIGRAVVCARVRDLVATMPRLGAYRRSRALAQPLERVSSAELINAVEEASPQFTQASAPPESTESAGAMEGRRRWETLDDTRSDHIDGSTEIGRVLVNSSMPGDRVIDGVTVQRYAPGELVPGKEVIVETRVITEEVSGGGAGTESREVRERREGGRYEGGRHDGGRYEDRERREVGERGRRDAEERRKERERREGKEGRPSGGVATERLERVKGGKEHYTGSGRYGETSESAIRPDVDKIKEGVKGVVHHIPDEVNRIKEEAKGVVNKIPGKVHEIKEEAKGLAKGVVNQIPEAAHWVKEEVKGVASKIPETAHKVKEEVKDVVNKIPEEVKDAAWMSSLALTALAGLFFSVVLYRLLHHLLVPQPESFFCTSFSHLFPSLHNAFCKHDAPRGFFGELFHESSTLWSQLFGGGLLRGLFGGISHLFRSIFGSIFDGFHVMETISNKMTDGVRRVVSDGFGVLANNLHGNLSFLTRFLGGFGNAIVRALAGTLSVFSNSFSDTLHTLAADGEPAGLISLT
ncbi:unnamed protein product [Cylicocyclus nassatus]|uniref:Uncharacterized protein n=1 Tax=Cylicocyclus nassatus TaxID=53992 RepID=A0AA36M5U4_CYLNA|nr:unnamed protein product [Cylicocyclus nassatus]